MKSKNILLVFIIISLVLVGSAFLSNNFAVIQPNINVQPGDTVQFDAREYMDCGICDLARYQATIDGYRIKVFNNYGNLIDDNFFYNEPNQPWGLRCGEYSNIAYQYTVPESAQEGTWRIELEVAISPVWPPDPECIVAQDEGTFTVGTSCANKDQELRYCIDENTQYYKPAGSCVATYTNCDDIYGNGYKCQDTVCKLVEICGDGICDDFENSQNCYEDCGYCGDKRCNGPETAETCPEDCYACGDGTCLESEKMYCGQDCAVCGDGNCYWYEYEGEAYYCQVDCYIQPPGDVCPPIMLLGFIPIPDLWCMFMVWLGQAIFALTIVAMIFGGIISTLVAKQRLKPYAKGGALLAVSIIIGLLVVILIWYYLLIGLLFLVIYLISMRFIGGKK